MKQFLLPCLVTGILILLAGCFEKEDTTVYRNELFELSVPSNWVIMDDLKNSPLADRELTYQTVNESIMTIHVIIETADKSPKSIDLNQYVAVVEPIVLPGVANGTASSVEKTEISIAGINGKKISAETELFGGIKMDLIAFKLLEKKNVQVFISFVNDSSDTKDIEKRMAIPLESFKLTR